MHFFASCTPERDINQEGGTGKCSRRPTNKRLVVVSLILEAISTYMKTTRTLIITKNYRSYLSQDDDTFGTDCRRIAFATLIADTITALQPSGDRLGRYNKLSGRPLPSPLCRDLSREAAMWGLTWSDCEKRGSTQTSTFRVTGVYYELLLPESSRPLNVVPVWSKTGRKSALDAGMRDR